MKITFKWIVWFSITALWIGAMGGFACFYMFNFIFDKKLQSEMNETVRARVSFLVENIANSPSGEASVYEIDAMQEMMNNDPRIVDIIYMNPNATIRWYKDPELWRKPYEIGVAEHIFPTNAVYTAFTKQTIKINTFGKGAYYDMAFPMKGAKDVLAGVVALHVSRTEAKSLIAASMTQYAFGAFIVLLAMGVILWIFINYKIVDPLKDLNTAVRTVSLKDITLAYPERSDEIGAVAVSLNELFTKLRRELDSAYTDARSKKGAETVWWQSLLAVSVARGSRAIVVDHDNNVMFTNFELKVDKEGPIHLLDIFGGDQPELIEVVGHAMDAAGKVFRGVASISGRPVDIRAVQLPGDIPSESRTMIVLEPQAK